MNVVMITTNDPAGTAITFSKAINRYSDHRCRLITTEIRYNFFFEKDLHLPHLGDEGLEEVDQVLRDADIIHFHLITDESIQLGPFKVHDYLHGKKILHHHHGHPHFRANPEHYRGKYQRLKRRALVSTPDLLRLLPEARWQPNIAPIEDDLYRPGKPLNNDVCVVGQAPTRKDLKNTDDLIQVMQRLQETLGNIKTGLDIIENCAHTECLKRKNLCHIIFDHMQGYYGVSSLESLSQGKPVIAGLDEWNIKCIRDYFGADRLPWVIRRTKDDLLEGLRLLVSDHELRESIGKESRRFMEDHWTEANVIRSLVEVYKGL
jgi:hypothetical protein